MTLLALITLTAISAPPPAVEPEDCQLNPAAIPAFTLVDENPNSATYSTEVSSTDFLGEVLVMYWAQAT